MNTISPGATVVSAILMVVVLIVAFRLRGRITRSERGNEFFPWERAAHSADKLFETEVDESSGDEDEKGDVDEDEEGEDNDEYNNEDNNEDE